VPRDQADGALALGAIGWIFIVESAELPARAAGRQSDPAGGLDALRLKLALNGVELGVGREQVIAVRLDIDLVELELRGDPREIAVECRPIGEPLGVADGDVDRRSEILVRRGVRRLRSGNETECRDGADDPLQTNALPPRLLALP